jgi:hypothetical protein
VLVEGLGEAGGDVEANMAVARALAAGTREPSTPTERWYADQLAPHLGG